MHSYKFEIQHQFRHSMLCPNDMNQTLVQTLQCAETQICIFFFYRWNYEKHPSKVEYFSNFRSYRLFLFANRPESCCWSAWYVIPLRNWRKPQVDPKLTNMNTHFNSTSIIWLTSRPICKYKRFSWYPHELSFLKAIDKKQTKFKYLSKIASFCSFHWICWQLKTNYNNLFVTSKKRNHQFTNLKCCKMSFKAFKM